MSIMQTGPYYISRLKIGHLATLVICFFPESGAGPADARHDLDDGVAAPGAPAVDAHPRVDALLSQLRSGDSISVAI